MTLHLNQYPAGTESKQLRLHIARTIPELEEFREIWSQWCDDPFADFDFFLVSARCRETILRPHVMVVYRDGLPDCMLIGRLEETRLTLSVGYATLFRPQVRRLFFVQGGFLGNQSKENSEFLVREIMACLQRGEAETAEFHRVREDSSLYDAARKQPKLFCRGSFLPVQEHRSVRLPENFEQFLHGLSRKNRHELRRHEKRLSDAFAGQIRIQCYRTEEELPELTQEVRKVSEGTYQNAIGAGFKSDVENYEALRTAAQQGGLRGCVLYVREKPCAFFIGNHYKNTFHGSFTGFDSRLGKYSPGLYILMHCIEECFEPEHRATQIDLGWGDRQYKRAICNQSWRDGPLFLYSLSFAGLKLNCLRSTTALIDQCARKWLVKSTFLQQLKKAWLRWLQKSRGSLAPCQEDGDDATDRIWTKASRIESARGSS